MWNSLVMMVIDSKTAIHIVNGWVNNTSSNQNYTHRATFTQTGLTYYLHLYIHICLQSKVRRGQWRGAGHRDYWITQGLSIYWAQCSLRGWGQSLPLAQYTLSPPTSTTNRSLGPMFTFIFWVNLANYSKKIFGQHFLLHTLCFSAD